MVGFAAIIAIGLLLGMRHATDPDHVIAVSTIVTREHSIKRSAWIGVAWGLGHTFTIFLVGSAMILFRIVFSARIGLGMELAVGLMLIILGIKNLGALFSWSADSGGRAALADQPRYHAHGDYVHAHPHAEQNAHAHGPLSNPLSLMDRWFRNALIYRSLRPFIIGVVHGLAGSAAIALLVLSTISSAALGLIYLAVFGMGTVLGMMVITTMMASGLAYGQKRFSGVDRHLGWAAGAISLAFGLFIAYHIGFVDGLFLAHPHWTPR